MTKAEETRFLKVLHDGAIGPGRKRSIEDVALEVYDGADHEATKYGRKLYAQLDPSPDKEYDRLPAVKLPAFFRATGNYDGIYYLAHLFNLQVYDPGRLSRGNESMDIIRGMLHNIRLNTEATEKLMAVLSPDSPGGCDITRSEGEPIIDSLDKIIETALAVKSSVKIRISNSHQR